MTRAGLHIRGRRIVGNKDDLTENGIKVLAAIKFSPTSITREEIMQKTNLPKLDVERQVDLLRILTMVKDNARFPLFPTTGWRVYTDSDKHAVIMSLLRRHGYQDEESQSARTLLRGYYPTGLDLEGEGTQPNRGGANYTGGVPIIEDLDFKPSTIAIMREFRDRLQPFRPREWSEAAVEEKKGKWSWFVQQMAANYHIELPSIKWGEFSEESWGRDGSSYKDALGRSSSYNPSTHTLFFTGKFSIVTLLHEFGHARGFDERDAIIWSVNLGRRVFPITFARLQRTEGSHVLVRRNRTPEFGGL